MTTVTIGLATRGRPKMVIPTIERTLANIKMPSTRYLICLDDDDLPTIEALQARKFDHRVTVCIKPREDTVADKWNRIITEAPADVYVTQGDFSAHCTSGFDQKIARAAAQFPDGIGVVYSHMENLSFSYLNAVTAKLVDKMGYIYPPYFPFWFVDHWLDDVARMIGRIAFVDIEIDVSARAHRTTQELRELEFWTSFYDCTALDRHGIARRIIRGSDFIEPEWRKKMLPTLFPLIDGRSRMVNHFVRSSAASISEQNPAGEAGDRYLRIKSQAIRMLKSIVHELKKDPA